MAELAQINAPETGLPVNVKLYSRPLNVGAQPAIIDSSADISKTQVAIITPDGSVAVMNMGTFITKMVDLETADKATSEQLAEAINNTQAAIDAQKEATDQAIDDVNKSISGQGTSLGATINAVKSEADGNKTAITALQAAMDTANKAISANSAQIKLNQAAIAKNAADIVALQAAVAALVPKP